MLVLAIAPARGWETVRAPLNVLLLAVAPCRNARAVRAPVRLLEAVIVPASGFVRLSEPLRVLVDAMVPASGFCPGAAFVSVPATVLIAATCPARFARTSVLPDITETDVMVPVSAF